MRMPITALPGDLTPAVLAAGALSATAAGFLTESNDRSKTRCALWTENRPEMAVAPDATRM